MKNYVNIRICNIGYTIKIIIFLGGDIMLLKERLYDETNSEVESFQLVIGYIAGYNREELESENKYDDIEKFNSLYYQIAQKVFEENGVFVTAFTYKSRVLYPDCPEGGEKVYVIEGARNSYFTKDKAKYKNAVNRLARILASELEQTTYSIVWQDVKYSYFKKE